MNLQLTKQEFLIIQKLIYTYKQDVVCDEGNEHYCMICELSEKMVKIGRETFGKTDPSTGNLIHIEFINP